MKPAPTRPDDRFATMVLLSGAMLFLIVAGYLFASSFLIENECTLAGDPICVPALRRVWAAGGMAGVFVVITGAVCVTHALRSSTTARAARDRRE